MIKYIQSLKEKDSFYYCIIVFVAGILFWRAKYGFIWSDEPFYFETAYRFMQGDRPIINEWYTTQIYSIILVPYMKLMNTIIGNGFSGLFIISRYLYVCIQLLVGIICYRIFSKKSKIAALFGSIIFMIFCRGNIGTISYYSVCSASLCLALMLAYNEITITKVSVTNNIKGYSFRKTCTWILIGILWGIAIICNPYLTILFVLYFIFLILYMCKVYNSCRYVLLMSICTIIIGILFIYDILHNAGIEEIITGISYVMSDSAYFESYNLIYKLCSGFLYISYRFRYTIVFSIISLTVLIVINIKRQKKKISLKTDARISFMLFIINTVILAIDSVYPMHSAYTTGTCMAALAIWGMQIYLISYKEDSKLFILMYVPGWIAALLMSAASDTRYSATTQGLMIAAVASIIMGAGLLDRWQNECADCICIGNRGRIKKMFLTVICCILICTSFYDRLFLVYRDRPMDQLTEKLNAGPAKGIVTTSECQKRYDDIWNTMGVLSEAKGNLYIMNFCPWAYLATSMKCSPYTTWRIMPDMDDTMGQQYYDVHPEKFPDIVFRLANEYTEYDEKTLDYNGASANMDNPEKNSLDYAWNNSRLIYELGEKNYRIVEVPCGRMYIRNSSEYSWITEELFTENE